MSGKVLDYILEKVSNGETLHFSLIDPDPFKQSPEVAGKMAKIAEEAGTDAIMIGGSTVIESDTTVKSIKKNVTVPVILFPGNLTGISKYADAIFFMSLLNSSSPYWITGAQAIAAPIIKKIGIEPISMAYIIIAPGGTAGYMGYANLIPRDKTKIAVAYAVAAELLGFKLIYLEAGSGADKAVPLETVKAVSSSVDVPVIVGGGINTPKEAANVAKMGANIIVQGSFLEKTVLKDNGQALKKVITAIKASKE